MQASARGILEGPARSLIVAQIGDFSGIQFKEVKLN